MHVLNPTGVCPPHPCNARTTVACPPDNVNTLGIPTVDVYPLQIGEAERLASLIAAGAWYQERPPTVTWIPDPDPHPGGYNPSARTGGANGLRSGYRP